jgi:Tol biopolymer transport system component
MKFRISTSVAVNHWNWLFVLSFVVLLLAMLLTYVVATPGLAYAAFPGTNGQITYAEYDATNNDFHIFVANPDGSHQFQLTTLPSLVSDWSPDGSRIAFDFFDGQTVQIATISPDATGFVQLTQQETAFHGEPAWSPDGTQLAFESDAGNFPAGEGIYIMNALTGNVLSRVTANPFGLSDTNPRWSPDGQWIAFTRFIKGLPRNALTAVFLVHSDGTDLHQLTPLGMNADNADWSPDGSTIAFYSHSALPAPSNIYTIRPDGSGLRLIVKSTGHLVGVGRPRWAPDGTKLIIDGSPNAHTEEGLFVVNPDGTNLTQLLVAPPFVASPSWGTHPLQ